MSPQRWQTVEELFHQALERPPAERESWIDRMCAGDAELRSEVASLLASDEAAAGRFVGSQVKQAVVELHQEEGRGARAMLGRQIGPYRLVRELGRGGMGAVYLAQRDDEHYESQVAIKLVRPGLDTDFILRRFRRERQILARLQHPNIARLFDGGTSDDGTPYLVMEYIQGAWITRHAETKNLTIEARLRLFLPVCAAVEYAHHHFVVHRDLKPGNILIDDSGAPKLLDFGISKLLQATPDDPGETQGVGMMTPDYASPEQILGDPVTILSDIYSLGAVLYELLSGAKPHRIEQCTPLALERAICLDQTAAPSAAARNRDLARRLRGDLDHIILRAMQKDPGRRYQSVEQLADDIRRRLDHRPVSARPDSLGYRAGKLLRRYPMAVLATVLVILSLAAGLIAATHQARLAQRRFEQVRTLAASVIFDLSEGLKDLPGNTETRTSLVRTALPYLDSLVAESASDPKLLWDLGRAYVKIGDLQGAPAKANLGRPAEALVSYRKALRAFEAIPVPRPDAVIEALANLYHDIGFLEAYRGDSADADRDSLKALQLANTYYAANPLAENRERVLAASYKLYGESQLRRRDTAGALASFRAGLAAFRGAMPKEEDSRRRVSTILARIGDALLETGPVTEAIEYFRRDLAIREEQARAKSGSIQFQRDLFVGYITIGNALGGSYTINMGDISAAREYFGRALAIARSLAQQDPRNSRALSDLAFAYAKMGEVTVADPSAAIEWFHKSLAITRELLATDPDSIEMRKWNAERHRGLADALDRASERRAARDQLEEALAIWRSLSQAGPARLDLQHQQLSSQCQLCSLARRMGDLDGAIEVRDEALSLMRQMEMKRTSLYVLRESANCYEAFALLDTDLAAVGGASGREHRAAARDWHRKSLAVWDEWLGRGIGDPPSFGRRNAAAAALARAEAALGAARLSTVRRNSR